jgi:UDP-N-acetylglucosamine diphosphorylase / glucose-1-phosphate thymidylyltransferase / UDP-N-acetylgalactosamine diphosphorylase / glucosamine-1-phosphate N-acetyltransferase / galactosamine-1-phosphate N-acetyltransferase
MLNKVLISAAGRGTRMLHLSQDRPKHLIEVNGKPFLYYVLNNLKLAGFHEFILVVGYKKEMMDEFFDQYKNEFNLQIINQFEVMGDEKYGTAMPLLAAEKYLANENFLAIYGDNLYSIEDLQALNIDDNFNYIAGLIHQHPEKFGVLIRDDQDFLEKIIEKPETYVGNLINTGLYKFTPDVFAKLPLVGLSSRGEYELTDAISMLAHEKKVKIKEIKNFWLDFGKPEDVQTISEFLNKN